MFWEIFSNIIKIGGPPVNTIDLVLNNKLSTSLIHSNQYYPPKLIENCLKENGYSWKYRRSLGWRELNPFIILIEQPWGFNELSLWIVWPKDDYVTRAAGCDKSQLNLIKWAVLSTVK